jgi:TDG/mug DNA glycosylase family protein
LRQDRRPVEWELEDFKTLPDHLAPGLDIVLVGLNPSEYSVRQGHYFANPRNRFWAAFNRSGLAPRELAAETDALVVDYGLGFTDVVKRPTAQGSGLKAADFRLWAPRLKDKMLEYRPRIVCFQGAMGYGQYLRHVEGIREKPALGRQALRIGESAVFLVPNPSPANAQFSLDDLVRWFQRLQALRLELKA